MKEGAKMNTVVKSTIIDNLRLRNDSRLNIPAIEYFGQSFTYGEFFETVSIYAQSLFKAGIKEGDIVTLSLAASPDCLFLFYGLNQIGAVANMVNPKYLKADCKRYLDQTNSKMLFILDKWYREIYKDISLSNNITVVLTSLSDYLPQDSDCRKDLRFKSVKRRTFSKGDNIIKLKDFLAKYIDITMHIPTITYTPERPAAIFNTSGTTGMPKGIILTNDGFNNMVSIYDEMRNGLGRKPGSRNLVIIPPIFASGMSQCVNIGLAFGCTNVLQPIYDKKTFVADLKKYKPQMVTATPSHYATLIDVPMEKDCLSFLQYPFTGGEPLTAELAIAINKKLSYCGVKETLVMGYGMSEFGTLTTINVDVKNRLNEAGYALPNVYVRIVDPATDELAKPNQRGEIQINTPCRMKGYYNNSDLTNEFFNIDEKGEKWGKTGDIASINEQGIIFVYGRASDNYEDEHGKIRYLFDFESIVSREPAVKECEAVAMHYNGKTVPAIFIVLHKPIKTDIKEILLSISAQISDELEIDKSEILFKIRNNFKVSEVSGKRDCIILKEEKKGFYKISNGKIKRILIG